VASSEIIPFGKYRGQPLEVLRNDPGYVQWLTGQDWFRERFATIHTVIVNNFAEPSETPAHKTGGQSKDSSIPISYLHECFLLDPKTSALAWRARPREHFVDEPHWRMWNTRYAEKPAMRAQIARGYRGGWLTFGGKRYTLLAHRIIWALTTGAWPANQIDHRNGDPGDNRISNLREATAAENAQNIRAHDGGSSSFVGVSWNKRRRKWSAFIQSKGVRRGLGDFQTAEAAYAAYIEAKRRWHSFQPVPRIVSQ
jgi:hypothetical protein